jgi:N-acetylglucosamine kinase-like BadF-type ATPase
MTYYMGVDGGGSTLRIVITDADLNIAAHIEKKTSSNPSAIGREPTAALIRQTTREALDAAGLPPESVVAVALGISGGDAIHAEDWLVTLMPPILPDAQTVASSDYEIALVGANGARRGVLLLSGTGSVAYAVNAAGESGRAGGWGYLIGDEGSGYGIAAAALRAVVQAFDGRGEQTALTERIMAHLSLPNPENIINWLYTQEPGLVTKVAKLTPLVIDVSADGDAVASGIVDDAAAAMVRHYDALVARLHIAAPQVAFAGGLLLAPTLLRDRLVARLGMDAPPVALYPPVMGAALLARLVTAGQ